MVMENNLIKIFEETVINKHDGTIINDLIKLSIINLTDLTKEIIKTNNAKYIYELAHYIKDAPIDVLANEIIKANNIEYIYNFAKNVKNAPIDELTDAIIKSNNAEYIFNFARNNYET